QPLSLFLSTGTSSTDMHTLSLHDALPIFLRNEVQQRQQGSGVLAVRLHDDGLKVEEIETPSPDPGEVLVRVHAAAITRGELEWPDRKSTRLNSSHEWISYAVFCLKKKTLS